jgi:hypothetical protein
MQRYAYPRYHEAIENTKHPLRDVGSGWTSSANACIRAAIRPGIVVFRQSTGVRS